MPYCVGYASILNESHGLLAIATIVLYRPYTWYLGMPQIKISKETVDQVALPQSGQVIYRDTELNGFALRVTPQCKTYIVDKWLSKEGRPCRVTLGKHGSLAAKDARRMAQQKIAEIADGHDLNAIKREEHAKSVSLSEVFEDYIASRQLKKATVGDYQKILKRCFSDWLEKPVCSITKDMVERRFKQLEKHPAQANLSMRILRALLTYASGKYDDSEGRSIILENPVRRLSDLKMWKRVNRRKTAIRKDLLPAWFDAVEKLDNPHIRDYLILCLLTGLRRNEAAGLKWTRVDLKLKTLTIEETETKNHDEHNLPLSDYLYRLLRDRWQNRHNEYVFPGAKRHGQFIGHLIEPKKAVSQIIRKLAIHELRELGELTAEEERYVAGEILNERVKQRTEGKIADVVKDRKLHFMIHDLRRTFLSIAESLDIPHYALKQLANHKDGGDVTAGYLVRSVDRLREPMQRITDRILEYADRKKSEHNSQSPEQAL